ncbi:MAG: peptidylprolyl isomerase [Bacteroidetes bacterium]|nr:peptidylprolyl isomerase [Bacteroidota bacterium]
MKNLHLQKAVLVTAFFLSLLFSATGCGSAGADIDVDPRVLATVNGHDVSVTWFEQTYINFLIQTGGNDTLENRSIHLENLIDGLLLAGAFEDQELDSSHVFQRTVARKEKSILAERYFDEEFLLGLEPPTEEDLRATFVRSKDQVVVRHLYFFSPVDAAASWERLENGTPFLEEAQRVYQTAAFDSSAGYLGPIKYFSVDDAFAEAAFSTPAGEYSEPVRSRFGYHIILVEDRYRQPLITESEYQTKKNGVSSQFRLRKRRLEGDQFVRGFMEDLNVVAQQKAIEALNSLLQDFANTVSPRPRIVQPTESQFEIDSLRLNMNPETILATYEWEGELQPFTAGDYLFWLEDLPFQEALGRTAASVGRAMRNELLAKAGEEAGYDDATADALLDRELLLLQARMMRDRLRMDKTAAVPADLIERAMKAKGIDRRQQFRADFNWLPAGTEGEAQQIRTALVQKRVDPDQIPGMIREQDRLLMDIPELAQHVRNAPIDSIVVVGTGTGWGVLTVLSRTAVDMSSDDERQLVIDQLRPLAREYELVAQLREEADISVDGDLFDQIFNVEQLKRELRASE